MRGALLQHIAVEGSVPQPGRGRDRDSHTADSLDRSWKPFADLHLLWALPGQSGFPMPLWPALPLIHTMRL